MRKSASGWDGHPYRVIKQGTDGAHCASALATVGFGRIDFESYTQSSLRKIYQNGGATQILTQETAV